MKEIKIDADMDAISLGIQDAYVCGTGVVKFWFKNGKLSFDHVPTNEFLEFGNYLKRISEKIGKENPND